MVPTKTAPKPTPRPKKGAGGKTRFRVPDRLAYFFLSPVGRILLISFTLILILFLGGFAYVYAKYSRVIDERLRAGVIANNSRVYAMPVSVGVGDAATPAQIAAELRRSGYSESSGNATGWYRLRDNAIEIFPGTQSYFDQEAGILRFKGNKIVEIVSLRDNTQRSQYQLEPQIVTNLSGQAREKRRMVHYQDIPPVLVQAVTSAEDKRFFQHAGFDPIRVIKAAYVDLKEGRKEQGASTLSMQLARMVWLDMDKKWSRKLAEVIITLQLEQKLSKEQIFEYYANMIDLGYRGTYNIRGFGQAAEAYLGKDLSQINIPEAAELAGLIQRPGAFDPFRNPEKTKARRNVVLGLMRQNGFINDRDYAVAMDTPIVVPKGGSQSLEAPYFVDLVNEALQAKFQEADFHSEGLRVYTTLDVRLQRAAADAIRVGMEEVDKQIAKQRRFRGKTPPQAQVALVAIDPHTGEVKALAGGRNYGMSQLNHALAKRQPGSIFKPFVYAAALDTGVEGGQRILTASTIVNDSPTTFWFDGKPYEPGNFGKDYFGDVTLRFALAHSLNVATVKVAEMVGYDAVVDMANRAGMNYQIQPTPAVALGAYEITPLEAAGAYTMFANQGDYVKPSFLRLVRSQDGKVLYKNKLEEKQVLDKRVAFLVTDLMEEVLRSGTAAGVRARQKLDFPAAGKTGTSHDGWFAGFTSELLCVVWVGFDDNSELDLEGAHSAAPIWAEFMKRAVDYREYRDTKPFQAPDGIVSVQIDPASGMPATPNCPKTQSEEYIAGTEPVGSCPLHGGGGGRPATNITGWETPATPPPAVTGPDGGVRITGSGSDGAAKPRSGERTAKPERADTSTAQAQPPKDEKKPQEKKGIFRRLLDVFK